MDKNIKNKLKSYAYQIEYAKELEIRIKEIRESMTSIKSMQYDSIGGSSGENDRLGTTIARLVDLENSYLDKIAEIAEMEKDINTLLDMLEPKEQKLIRLRYMQSRSWEEVCSAMAYSWQGVHKMHNNILNKLEKSRLK